jgi:hypothetical protein
MDQLTPFERQVAGELRTMVGSSTRFDPFEVARAAAATPRTSTWRMPAPLGIGDTPATAVTALLAGLVALGLLTTEWLAPQTGRELSVAADGTGQFETIAAAVDVAQDGDVIVVYPGTYEESLLITQDIALRGGGERASDVVLRIPADGPALRLQDADVTVARIAFLSTQPSDQAAMRRPAIDIEGGRPLLEGLEAHADEPVAFTFVRLAATERGTVLRDSVSSGGVRANRGAQVSIEDSVLRRAEPGAPAVGIALGRTDTNARIVGNTLNYVHVDGASAYIDDNDIAGASALVQSATEAASFREGKCGVSALLGWTILVDNRIHDNQTGVCGAAWIEGGRIFDNRVGVWSGRSGNPGYLPGRISDMHVEDATVRDNVVGVRGASMSETVLRDVQMCGNQVRTDLAASASLDDSGSVAC